MKRAPRQAGFSAVIAIAVVLVVAGLGFAAWRISQTPDKKTTNNSPVTSPKQTQKTKSSDPSEGGKYLVIKEWGVRFKLPAALQGDISYFMNTRAEEQSGGPILVDLTSKK